MVEGRGREAWLHTSNLLALIANVNRDPKKGVAVKAMDLNPYLVKEAKDSAIVIENLGDLRHLFESTGKGKQ